MIRNTKKNPFVKGGFTKSQQAAKNAQQRLRNKLAMRRMTNPAITKFSSHSFRVQETKTLDFIFSGAYALGVYTPDTVPFQMLPINTSTNVVQCLNLVQQGAGISQRIGNKITLKSLRLRMKFEQTAVINEALQLARIMVIYDRQPNGTYPATNSILSDSLQNNTIQSGTVSSNLNPNFFDRMVVLKDDFIRLGTWQTNVTSSNTYAPTTEDAYVYDHHIKLKNLESQYNGTANPMTIAYVNIGAVYILVYGDFAANTESWQLNGSARLRFRDN